MPKSAVIHCLYCDNKETVDMFSSKIREPRCEKCKETQLLKIIKNTEETGDYFGYRFDSETEKEVDKKKDKEESLKETLAFPFDWMGFND